MVDHSSAVPLMSLLNDMQASALAGDEATGEIYTFGSATAVIGNAGTVIIVEAGDARDRSSVWNAEEVRLLEWRRRRSGTDLWISLGNAARPT